MNPQERTLTYDEINKIYESMSTEDKKMIDYLILDLEDNFKKRWRDQLHALKPAFGPKQALELLCKLSMFMIQEYGQEAKIWNLNDNISGINNRSNH